MAGARVDHCFPNQERERNKESTDKGRSTLLRYNPESIKDFF